MYIYALTLVFLFGACQRLLETGKQDTGKKDTGINDTGKQVDSTIKDTAVDSDKIDTSDTGDIITPPLSFYAVHFIDVGQGDAALITVDDQNILVDCGETDKGDEVVAYLQKQGITTLNYLLVTHGHSDHLGGCSSVLENFSVEAFWDNGEEYTTATYRDTMDMVDPAIYHSAQLGDSLKLGEAQITILHSGSDYPSDDENNNSIVFKLSLGESGLLMTGDCEAGCETETINNSNSLGISLLSEILKVPHHGSSDSSTKEFLDEVLPQLAVISVGDEYGLPDKEAIKRLQAAGAEVLTTYENGTMVITADASGKYYLQ